MMQVVAQVDLVTDDDSDGLPAPKGLKKGSKNKRPTPKAEASKGDRASMSQVAQDADGREGGLAKVESNQCDSRGRPKQCPKHIASEYWTNFTTGKMQEHFFGKRNLVMRRLLTRWARTASDRAIKDTENQDLIVAKKKLQIMEIACGMVSSWHARKTVQLGICKFVGDWSIMITSCAQEPCLHLCCPTIWSLHLEIQCHRIADETVNIVPDLKLSELEKRYPEDTDIVAVQRRFSCQWVASSLSVTTKLATARKAIRRFALSVGDCSEFDITTSVSEQSAVLKSIVCPITLTKNPESLATLLASQAALVEIGTRRGEGNMLGALFYLPELGSKLVKELDDSVAKF